MAAASIRTAGVSLVLVPTVAYGGGLGARLHLPPQPGYLDNRSARTCSGPATPTPAC